MGFAVGRQPLESIDRKEVNEIPITPAASWRRSARLASGK
jgi:hypothetical protein